MGTSIVRTQLKVSGLVIEQLDASDPASTWENFRCPNRYCVNPVLFRYLEEVPSNMSVKCKSCGSIWIINPKLDKIHLNNQAIVGEALNPSITNIHGIQ